MFEWLFGRKKQVDEIELIKEATQKSFSSVRNDINNLSIWVKHLKTEDEKADFRFSQVEERLSSIESDLEGIKNSMAFMEGSISKRLFKQPQTAVRKQTAVQGVYDPVQTAVQTAEPQRNLFANLTAMERATVYVLLNSEMKLSYDDLAAMLGKSRATIRGQINSIKQKSEGLIEEQIEVNGKKRIFVPAEVKEILLKSGKVRVRKERR
ncbi:MAG: hypothetical protein KKB21_00035 [Nanoarchaeota archaeon]|nr:hypothetical protein [Nanoarchaeota archaeon]MBU4085948.1 hypothetical protein [Nanoarchaeota archaeon]